MNEAFGIPLPQLPSEIRRDARIAAQPAIYKTAHERMAYELALRLEPPEEVFARYQLTVEAAKELIASPPFNEMLVRIEAEVKEQGLTFRAKARIMAEDLLKDGYEMATDANTQQSVRADLIKWFTKVGDLEPAAKKDEGVKSGQGLTLAITFAGAAPQAILTGREIVTIDQETA